MNYNSPSYCNKVEDGFKIISDKSCVDIDFACFDILMSKRKSIESLLKCENLDEVLQKHASCFETITKLKSFQKHLELASKELNLDDVFSYIINADYRKMRKNPVFQNKSTSSSNYDESTLELFKTGSLF